jgi:DNA polymerase/3'-5' exonuclease PolX
MMTEKTLPKSTRRGESVMRVVLSTLERSGLLRNVSRQQTTANGVAHFQAGHQVPVWFICVSASEWPFALLRYTGPHDIWVQLQSAAASKGWRLTEKTLLNGYITVPALTEREVFKHLHLVYLPPTQRE